LTFGGTEHADWTLIAIGALAAAGAGGAITYRGKGKKGKKK